MNKWLDFDVFQGFARKHTRLSEPNSTVLALCSEVGEVAQALYREESVTKVIEELGDVLFDVALVASSYNVVLSDIVQRTVDKMEVRDVNRK